MNIKIQHSYSKEEAKMRAEKLIHRLKNEYKDQIRNLKDEWKDYTYTIEGTAKGYSISAIVEIKDQLIEVTLGVPLMLQVFSKKIRSVIEEQIRSVLSKPV
jgi:hypothetical protein